jgi:predicted DNA-binding antitoxin AbrB/MazE fold protein
VRPVRARYEDGLLKPEKPLKLRPGEHVGLIVLRQPDASRWNLERLAEGASEDVALAATGLDAWADALEAEDRR